MCARSGRAPSWEMFARAPRCLAIWSRGDKRTAKLHRVPSKIPWRCTVEVRGKDSLEFADWTTRFEAILTTATPFRASLPSVGIYLHRHGRCQAQTDVQALGCSSLHHEGEAGVASPSAL
jgi:hypothetical protein